MFGVIVLAVVTVCPSGETAVIVDTGAHVLTLCQEGAAVKTYTVALGRGGTGKRVKGDGKTPLGSYPLGEPAASRKFHVFIPVGYPTEAQERQGFTGGAIGIHGPARRATWLGDLTTWLDWTLGCVAVSSDAEIDEIAAWVSRAHAARVELR